MGRRALPKLDPAVDWSRHHAFLEEVPAPFDPTAWFGRSAPLEVEIGSGKGLFLLNWSAKYPETNYLGIEAAKKYARFAAYRLAKHERPNARVISGDAIRFFCDYLTDCSVAAIHIYFPDPWWKERHRRRRVIQPLMLGQMQRVLQPGGQVHFWTDVEEYFESTLGMIDEWTDWQGPFEVPPDEPEHDLDYRTHFERRMRLNDHPVFRAQFIKPMAE